MAYEVVITIDKPPYERILEVEASPSPGKAPDTSGPPGSGGPGYPPSAGIEAVRFAEDDPVEADRGDEVPSSFFSAHEEEIADRVISKESQRHLNRSATHPRV